MCGDLRRVESFNRCGVVLLAALVATVVPFSARAEPPAKAVGGSAALRDHANRLALELEKARADAAEAERELEKERQRARQQADQALDRDFARERSHGEETARFEKLITEARARLAEAKEVLEQKTKRMTAVELALAKVTAEEERVSGELRRAKEEQTQLTARVGKLEQAIASERRAKEETSAKLATVQKEKEATSSRLAAVQKEKQETASKLAAVQKEKEATSSKLAAVQKEKEATSSRLAAVQKEKEATSSRLAAVQKEKQETASKLVAAEKEKEETSSKLVATQKEVSDKETELAAAQASLAKSQEKIREREGDVVRLTAELEQTRTTSQERIAALSTELRDLQGAREQAEQLRVEAKRHDERATKLQAEVETVRRTLAAQEKTAEVASAKQQEEVEALRTRAGELEKELTTTREEQELATGLAQKLESERDDARRRLEQAQATDGVDIERRQQQLRDQKRELAALKKELAAAKAKQAEVAAAAPPPAPDSMASAAPLETEEPGELRRLLDLERERRATLEGELVRLSATGEVAKRYRESWQGLQAARADLLLLSERLGAEQKKREELEAEVTRAREAAASGTGETEAPLERLVEVAGDHGRETDRLEKELREATEEVVRLKGRLETIDSAQSAGPVLKELHEENEKLRIALKGAETKLVMLEGQAALAKRLAELVYSR